jgi:phage baseplate assembly protein V
MMISRAIVNLVDDSTAIQLLQISLLKDETKSGVERIQQFGFSSNPKKGAESVVVFVNGNRDHALVIAVDDSRYRIKNLPEGASVQYDWDGNYIKLSKENGIEINAVSEKVTIKASGDIEIGNTQLKTLVNESFKSIFDNHVHNVSVAGTPAAQTGITSSPVAAAGTAPIAVPPTPTTMYILGQAMPSDNFTNKVKVQ